MASFDQEALLACSRGELFGPDNFRLPGPPLLRFDRITEISANGGDFGQGHVRGALDVRPDHWFFTCQADDDRLMPAALGLEALWQLLGFFLAWNGGPGRGRALAVAQLKMAGTVSPAARLVEYGIDVRNFKRAQVTLGIADGWVKVDGFVVTVVKTLKFGLFTGVSVVSRDRAPQHADLEYCSGDTSPFSGIFAEVSSPGDVGPTQED